MNRSNPSPTLELFACTLGVAGVAYTESGVTALVLGDAAAVVWADLCDRACAAERRSSPASLAVRLSSTARSVRRVLDHASVGEDGAGQLTLAPRGTAFQSAVWRALRAIPRGQTATYASLARRIGRPAAVRAVGTACGANPIAVLIPCHRALRTDGGLGGYRWGLARKEVLLARESGALTASARATPSSA